jgi:riboflavin biosynthesis pyrimidine reductase
MAKTITRLFPTPSQTVELKGLYLAQRLHQQGSPNKPFVYANFLSSLDGRIAITDPESGQSYTPKELSSTSDFRLFMELHAQADCLITHGGYLRALAANKLGNILQVSSREGDQDLGQWRKANGLPPQPALVIASASLNFPIPDSLKQHNQQVYIATGVNADPERIAYWQDQGYPVLLTGSDQRVQGKMLIKALSRYGYQSLYLIAGPEMLDTMLREGQLSRLYQSLRHQLLGGEKFHTLVPGPMLGEQGKLQLNALYYDADESAGTGQFFCQFEPISK